MSSDVELVEKGVAMSQVSQLVNFELEWTASSGGPCPGQSFLEKGVYKIVITKTQRYYQHKIKALRYNLKIGLAVDDAERIIELLDLLNLENSDDIVVAVDDFVPFQYQLKGNDSDGNERIFKKTSLIDYDLEDQLLQLAKAIEAYDLEDFMFAKRLKIAKVEIGGKDYHYFVGDLDIGVGDTVQIPFGKYNMISVGTVLRIGSTTEEDFDYEYDFPIEKMKYIIGKIPDYTIKHD